jgi:hypothetical protein
MKQSVARTLTPFGFQTERRSFWEATARLVMLPHESHGYRGRAKNGH